MLASDTPETTPNESSVTVLFACSQDASAALIAAAYTMHGCSAYVRVLAAGPADSRTDPDPNAVVVLADDGLDMSALTLSTLDGPTVQACNVIVTLGHGNVHPFVPGVRYEMWRLVRLADDSLDGYRKVRDEVKQLVRGLTSVLPGPFAAAKSQLDLPASLSEGRQDATDAPNGPFNTT